MDDSFTGLDIPINLLCDQSKSLLGYFYGIHLDDEDDKEEKEPTILPELPDEIWEIIWGIKHAFEMKDVKLELLKYLVPSDGCGGWCPRGHCKWCQELEFGNLVFVIGMVVIVINVFYINIKIQ